MRSEQNSENDSGPTRSIRITQTGTYCSKNLGDATMQFCAAREVQARWPEIEVVVSSPFPNLDTKFYAPTKVEKSDRRRLILSTLRVMAAWVLKRWLKMPDRILAKLPLGAEVRSFLKSRLILDLSGDMLTEDYGLIVGYSHFLPLMLARALHRPYALCAQSIGPIRYLRPLAGPIFRDATFITVREHISSDEVTKLAPGVPLSVTADLAFLLQPCPPDRLNVLLQEQGLHTKQRPRIGISASALLAMKFQKERQGSYVELMAEICDAVSESLGLEVVLIPHVFGPRTGTDDRETIHQIAALTHHGVTQITAEYQPEEIKAIIGTCDVFFGARMHANMAALSSNIPTLAVAYSHKSLGIMSLYGLERYVIDADALTAKTALKYLQDLLHNRSNITREMTAVTVQLKSAARKNIDMISEYASSKKYEADL